MPAGLGTARHGDASMRLTQSLPTHLAGDCTNRFVTFSKRYQGKGQTVRCMCSAQAKSLLNDHEHQVLSVSRSYRESSVVERGYGLDCRRMAVGGRPEVQRQQIRLIHSFIHSLQLLAMLLCLLRLPCRKFVRRPRPSSVPEFSSCHGRLARSPLARSLAKSTFTSGCRHSEC